MKPFALALILIVAGSAQTAVIEHLRDVRTIYVGSLGDAFGAEMIRNKLVDRLVKSGQVEIVESSERADAILTGIADAEKIERHVASATPTFASSSGGTRFVATSAVRLINQQHKILWTCDESNGMLGRSVTSSVAERIVKSLTKAIKQDQKTAR